MTEGVVGGMPGGRAAAFRALRELVVASTVRIHAPAPGYDGVGAEGFLGSGFFVAPNWVLTCAHVARSVEGGELTVVHRSGPDDVPRAVPADVVVTLPEHPGRRSTAWWPAPDLALVRLRRPADHACVFLSDRPAEYYGGGQDVFYAGWTVVDGNLEFLDGTLSVRGTLGGLSSATQIRLGDNDLPPGVSGGPLVDLRRGETVGVLKSQSRGGGGGTAIGTEQLRMLPTPSMSTTPPVSTRSVTSVTSTASATSSAPQAPSAAREDLYQVLVHAHDRYHRDQQGHPEPSRPTWAYVQDMLDMPPDRRFGPVERAELLGRLADLPPPVSTPALLLIVESALGFDGGLVAPEPRGWRDGLGAVCLGARHGAVLERVLDFATQAMSAERPESTPATRAAERALWDWVWQRAGGLAPAQRARLKERHDRHFGGLGPWAGESPGTRSPESLGPRTAEGGTTYPGAAKADDRTGQRAVVMLELTEQAWDRGHFSWRILAERPEGATECRAYGGPAAPDALPEELAVPLGEAFRCYDERGRPALLEVVVPHTCLGLDIDAWELLPGQPPLGAQRPVVVRCADREQLLAPNEDFTAPAHDPSEDGGPYRHTRRTADGAGDAMHLGPVVRWHWLHTHDAHARVVDCHAGFPRPVPEVEELRALPPHVVPVLCRYDDGPSAVWEDALPRLVRGGFGVALWRRLRGPSPMCAEFHRGVSAKVAEAGGAGRLPDVVHRLRAGVVEGRTEEYWADGLTLLYDDPGRPLPGADQHLEAL